MIQGITSNKTHDEAKKQEMRENFSPHFGGSRLAAETKSNEAAMAADENGAMEISSPPQEQISANLKLEENHPAREKLNGTPRARRGLW